ncbi:biotin--[acetyl-CoA-carboxylase] ligase [Sneathiella marina]|uniref:biotin--[biotin carboxyl-carrier protein] ligase n=1 Tax=Sneathiella marina TaxID=2950108 RepID=A0ABY4W7U1_9PROT|nr:biotin--[acetyl-CoA-carboxylase] ligase [Sneathiella marina]USG63261.1 biotin--[acetyl-CoA-carboxylase] ligase [Sneathiella marina]
MSVGGGLNLPPFFDVTVFETIGSTNIEARRLAEEGNLEGRVVWSKRQEQGVGRRGRDWSSPTGNLYCSLLLRPECDPLAGARLSFLIAVALQKAIAAELPTDSDVKVKWPNDVLVKGHKISGILLESKTRPDGILDYVIVGTGVNVVSFPDITDGLPATSLKYQGAQPKLETLLSAYLHNFLELYMIWKHSGFAPIREQWLERAVGIGQQITVKLSDQMLMGIFSDLDMDGALVLRLDTGEEKLITAGEVFIVP